jgi:rubrerythrin
MTQDTTKRQIIAEFTSMKGLEECAYELYSKVSCDPQIADEKVRKVFEEIAEDEKRHIGLVQKVIDIATDRL